MSNTGRALVTGAGGFIGSHLVERLVRDGHAVRAYVHYNARNDWGNLELIDPDVRREVEVVTGDIADPFSVRRAAHGVRTIFHLSSLIAIPYSYVAPQTYAVTNVLGAINVLQAARDENVERVVHTSTSECYGTAQYVPIDERHPLQGQSPYSASKIGADMVAESYWRSFGLPVATVRQFEAVASGSAGYGSHHRVCSSSSSVIRHRRHVYPGEGWRVVALACVYTLKRKYLSAESV